MFRLYVDEVGTDGLNALDDDKHQFLSLTGVAIRLEHARDYLNPFMARMKSEVFSPDPDDLLVLHRKEIMGLKGIFQCLRDPNKCEQFNRLILEMFRQTEYTVITALIDKKWMTQQTHWDNKHPYHYLMEIMVEKYVQFLIRQDSIGDIMPESRQPPNDEKLQKAFRRVKIFGTNYLNTKVIKSRIPGENLKFRTKKDNIAGLQLCDLIAHPSHIYTRKLMGHSVTLGEFAEKVVTILRGTKYDRSASGRIKGYGIKHLP